MVKRFYTELDSPVGPVTIVSDGERITMLTLQPAAAVVRDGWCASSDGVLAEAHAQLNAYFKGELRSFSLPLGAAGTPFQKSVWRALEQIPFGITTSYGEIALAIGHAGSARAVGAANGANPIAIVVPCHRVIGRDGTLTGYAGGIERKSYLLTHEARVLGQAGQLQLELAATVSNDFRG